jgi:murein L,D-transpeptidase YcbB/YkuD
MILLNLDRMREQGAKFEPRHLIVNIPAQEAKVIDDGKVAFYSKAIVGKVDRKTPTLDSLIKLAKFNPEWNAPAKIASNDEVRRARADPNFLADHGFTIYDGNGMEVEPSAIDWNAVGPGNFPYRLVQAPGPENALGPVKLDFPNPESVYLHGTNQKQLFAKQDRYFSSGCMRLQQPVDMAAYLLADDPEWPRARIDQVVESGKTTYVPLKTPMPIHVVYMTAWVDEDGAMQFRKDMYRYDDYADIPAELQPASAKGNLIATVQSAKPTKTPD